MILRGWALAERGQREEGVTPGHQGLAAWRAMGAELPRTFALAQLAEAQRKSGRAEEGLGVLHEALTVTDKSGERWWEAELHRLKGELRLARSADHRAEAETCFHQALDVACRQEVKSLELRAAVSLSRPWQHQGKRDEACRLPHLSDLAKELTKGLNLAPEEVTLALRLLRTLDPRPSTPSRAPSSPSTSSIAASSPTAARPCRR
jgi:predicted ATPase